MTDTTRNPRGLRRAALALTAFALLVAAIAGLGAGSAAAKQGRGGGDSHFRHHAPSFPGHPGWPGGGNPGNGGWPGGGGSTLPGAGVPVPGQDTSLDPTELQPPPITVLKKRGEPRPPA